MSKNSLNFFKRPLTIQMGGGGGQFARHTYPLLGSLFFQFRAELGKKIAK